LRNGEGEGLDAPNADGPVSEVDLGELLRDMRDLRVTISQSAEQLGRLEKRLRGALKSR